MGGSITVKEIKTGEIFNWPAAAAVQLLTLDNFILVEDDDEVIEGNNTLTAKEKLARVLES